MLRRQKTGKRNRVKWLRPRYDGLNQDPQTQTEH